MALMNSIGTPFPGTQQITNSERPAISGTGAKKNLVNLPSSRYVLSQEVAMSVVQGEGKMWRGTKLLDFETAKAVLISRHLGCLSHECCDIFGGRSTNAAFFVSVT